jgi:hypothetical protein
VILKDGVKILGIRPELLVALIAAERVFGRKGHELVLTSVTDGVHSAKSLHLSGAAFDVRTLADPAIGAQEAKAIRDEVAMALGRQFDVVLEGSPPHLHVEFQPKD